MWGSKVRPGTKSDRGLILEGFLMCSDSLRHYMAEAQISPQSDLVPGLTLEPHIYPQN